MIDQQESWVMAELDRQALRAKQRESGQTRNRQETTQTRDGGNR